MRVALAGAALIGGYVSVTQSLGYVLRNQDPVRAHALSPRDGRITAQYGNEIISDPELTPADRQRAKALALRALRQDPTSVTAASVLGLSHQIDGKVESARRLFGYAQRLSRRELQVQIWAIEDAVARGDIPGILKHYDIALRTSRNAPDLLFPILAAAIADPDVRGEVVKTLSNAPAWGGAFMSYVAVNGADPRSAAALLTGLRRRSITLPVDASASVINGLIAAGFADEAWRYYAMVRPGSVRRQSRDPRFSTMLETPTLLDWTLFNDGNVTSSIQRGDNGGFLEFAAPPSVGGPILRQMQLLPPGDYRLSGYSRGIEQTASSVPYWTLTCQADGREFGRVDVPNSSQGAGAFGGTFRIPPDCPVQALTLIARPSGTMLGLAGELRHVQLVPAR
ncbi:hypothetical protein [Sphingomonas sp.]|uniref:hypothetical protein n=1 Tax=Sphingomonas sp. TaxID=28214 RepID=UPI00261C60E8|nr:hypothetical protein [Sphingomonas sp.]